MEWAVLLVHWVLFKFSIIAQGVQVQVLLGF